MLTQYSYHNTKCVFFLITFIFLGFPFVSAVLIRKTKAEFNKKVLVNFKEVKSESFLLSFEEQLRDQPQKVDNQNTSLKNQSHNLTRI